MARCEVRGRSTGAVCGARTPRASWPMPPASRQRLPQSDKPRRHSRALYQFLPRLQVKCAVTVGRGAISEQNGRRGGCDACS